MKEQILQNIDVKMIGRRGDFYLSADFSGLMDSLFQIFQALQKHFWKFIRIFSIAHKAIRLYHKKNLTIIDQPNPNRIKKPML